MFFWFAGLFPYIVSAPVSPRDVSWPPNWTKDRRHKCDSAEVLGVLCVYICVRLTTRGRGPRDECYT